MEGDVHEAERQNLTTKLLDSVKQCQIRFGGKTELATESDSRVSCLCASWESVLQHGLKHNNRALSTLKHVTQLTGLTRIGSGISLLDDIKNMETEPTFWIYAKDHLGKHDLQRYMLLRNITTDAGRGRAWLRAAINEHSLEKYMHMWIENQTLISNYYEDWSFMSDSERSAMLPNMAAGLGSILFAIGIDNSELNSIKPASGLDTFLVGSAPQRTFSPQPEEELRPVIAGDASPKVDKKKDKRRKKKAAHIISFDDGDLSSYSTSPASALASPKSLTFDLSGVPVINAMPASRVQGFKTCGVAHSSFEGNPPSPVKGHLRTGSCDSPLQYYNSQYKPGDSGHSLKTVLPNSGSQRSVHFRDIPEQHSMNGCSPNKVYSKDTIGIQYMQSSSVVSNDSGLEDDEKVKDSNEHITADVSPSKPIGSVPGQSDSTVSGSEPSDNTCTSTGVLETGLSSSGLATVKTIYSGDRTTNKNSPLSKPSLGFAPSALNQSDPVSKPALGDIGRTDSEMSNMSVTSDQSFADSASEMTPIPPSNQTTSEAITIVCSERGPQEDSTSDSYDSNEVLLYNEMAKHTAKALLAGQQVVVASGSDLLRTQGDGSHAPEPSLSQDAMTTAELKQAVIAMMGRKDEVEEHNKALMAALEHELGTSATLRLEIDEMRREHRNRIDKDADKIKALTRENELLKQQLKKYVNAVQMLRRQGAKSDDFPGIHLEDVQPEMPAYRPQIDYSHEASEYEKKLVQVAEMHGELMEFNELLQKHLLGRESVIRSLREELVNLRGPLPDNAQTCEDNLSLVSDSSSDRSRPLINIWIPSAFLRGSENDGHHVYQVFVRISDDEWNVYRRYSDFHSLHVTLKKRFPITSTFQFPPKKAIGSKEPKLVERRRKDLQAYLRKVVNLLVLGNPDLATTASKQTLVKTLPFFGDQPMTGDKKKAGKRDRGRRDGTPQRATVELQGSPEAASQDRQYTGL